MYKTCVLCGKRITVTFWVCAGCEKDHDIVRVRYAKWPTWIKAMVRADRRQRTIDMRELSFAQVQEDGTIHGYDPFYDIQE